MKKGTWHSGKCTWSYVCVFSMHFFFKNALLRQGKKHTQRIARPDQKVSRAKGYGRGRDRGILPRALQGFYGIPTPSSSPSPCVSTSLHIGCCAKESSSTLDGRPLYSSGPDGRKVDSRRVLVDVEKGRTVRNWRPRRLGGGLGLHLLNTQLTNKGNTFHFIVYFLGECEQNGS